MKLSLLPLQDSDVLRIRCEGLVSLRDTPNSEDPLSDLLGPRCASRAVLLDLVDTLGIDTSGVVWLVRVADSFNQAGGRLVVHSIPPLVQRTLDVLKLGSTLCTAPDEATATEIAHGNGQEPVTRPISEKRHHAG